MKVSPAGANMPKNPPIDAQWSLGPAAAALGFEELEESGANAHKVALVTGGSSGIGAAVSTLLAARGVRVYAASRHADPALQEQPLVHPIRLDVTDDRSVAGSIRHIHEECGRLDWVINNAGYAVLGAIEDTSLPEAREQFDTNFFGVMRIIQAALPIMRNQRRGRIVNISSVLGFVPAPYMGIYAASKHALEGYTQSLDHEVRHFGIRALLVEPYFTKTGLGERGRAAEVYLDAYRQQRAQTEAIIRRSIEQGEDPRDVAKVVWKAVTVEYPRLRYAIGRSARLATLRRWVPARLFDRTLRQQFDLPTD
jgi:NAD(P)-dependent dehydrogenase (short-subunit alcohol dehydrogenase family)